MDVHVFLEKERKRLRKTQDEMAELGGIKLRTYANYAAGGRVPDADFLVAIAAAGADVQYILTGQPSAQALSRDEVELLGHWRAAPLAVKAAAIGALQGGSASPGKIKQVVHGSVGQQASGDVVNQQGVNIEIGKKGSAGSKRQR